jgi:prevent-host-death family protein
MPASSFITATDVRKDFFDILDGLHKRPYPVVITHKSSPQGVLMSWEDYNGWVATMETLSDPEMMEAIRKGDEDIVAGRYQTLDQVEKELELGKYRKHVSGNSSQSSKKRSQKN